MYFEDNFNYTYDEISTKIRQLFLSYIYFEKKNKKNKNKLVIRSSKLVEYALKRLKINSYDFLNDNSAEMVNDSLRDGLAFLEQNELISNTVSKRDKFYNFFIKKQYYESSEFSREFDIDFVLSILYKLNFGYTYNVSDNYEEFYHTYMAHYLISICDRVVKIKIPGLSEMNVLALKAHMNPDHLLMALEKYNYSNEYDYIAFYSIKKDIVNVFSTKKPYTSSYNLKKLYLTINLEDKLKNEFKPESVL